MRSCGGPHVDRISNLPSNILDNILNYLPVRDAVRTSILSRKWRCQWVTMPHLVFDEKFERSLRRNYLPETIIYHILSLHKGAITKFLVKDSHDSCIYHLPPCGRWLFFLSNRYLEDLALSSHDHKNKMPLRMFDFKQLKHLYLEGFEISELPPTFKGFTRLVKLDLLDCCSKDGRLGKFLSKCPMLEYLNIQLPMGGVKEELPKDLDHLTVLKLGGVWFGDEGHASCVLRLIKSSPNLRCLDITMGYDDVFFEVDEPYDDEKGVAYEYVKAQHKVHVPFSCLEYVKIYGMFGSGVEMEFIKILLLRAIALRTLKFEFNSDYGGISPEARMIKKLDKFPWASNLVRITFVGIGLS